MEVNVRNIFADKNPKLARLIPGFIFRYIERIVHQKELNIFLTEHGEESGVPFIESAIRYFNVSIEVRNLENIPTEGRYLFVSNHPLGGFDGIILMKIIAENFGNMRVLVNDILMNIKNLESQFLPINKHGSQDKAAALAIDSAFQSDMHLLTFPAGLCSRKIKGEIVDLEWKKNFIHKAIATKRHIVPIHFSGRNSNFFYNLSKIRNLFGIKANIEMFYLVDELFKHRNGKFTITFGQPIDYAVFENKKFDLKEWAGYVKNPCL